MRSRAAIRVATKPSRPQGHRVQRVNHMDEVDVGGAVDEVLRQAVGDGRRGAHAARADHHAAGQERPAGDAGLEVAVVRS